MSRKPGVQNPHWRAWWSRNASCRDAARRRPGRGPRPSYLGAVRLHGEHQARPHRRPSTSTVHAPQTPCSQPRWVPVEVAGRPAAIGEERGARPRARAHAVHATPTSRFMGELPVCTPAARRAPWPSGRRPTACGTRRGVHVVEGLHLVPHPLAASAKERLAGRLAERARRAMRGCRHAADTGQGDRARAMLPRRPCGGAQRHPPVRTLRGVAPPRRTPSPSRGRGLHLDPQQRAHRARWP